MTVTSSSMVNRPFVTALASAEPQSKSVRGGSLLSLVKTTGVLALALSQGAQAAGVRGAQANRHLEQKANTTALSDTYDYNKACKTYSLDTSVEGLNYEDCSSQGLAVIDASSRSRKSKTLKDCYQISGYLAAAGFSAGAVFACIVPSHASAIFGTGASIGVFSLISLTLCEWRHDIVSGQVNGSKDAVEDCCKELPKKAEEPAV